MRSVKARAVKNSKSLLPEFKEVAYFDRLKGKLENKMNVQTDRAKKPHSVRSKLRTLVLVAGCTVCLNGQAVTFIDPANLVENFTQRVQSAWQFAKDNSQYAKEAQYFIDQARRWKQQYDAAMAMIDLQSYRSMLPGGIKLEKIDDEYMVKERCGGEAPNVFSISGLKEIITSKVEETLNSEGIDKQQKKPVLISRC